MNDLLYVPVLRSTCPIAAVILLPRLESAKASAANVKRRWRPSCDVSTAPEVKNPKQIAAIVAFIKFAHGESKQSQGIKAGVVPLSPNRALDPVADPIDAAESHKFTDHLTMTPQHHKRCNA